jgi:hypothetical protein
MNKTLNCGSAEKLSVHRNEPRSSLNKLICPPSTSIWSPGTKKTRGRDNSYQTRQIHEKIFAIQMKLKPSDKNKIEKNMSQQSCHRGVRAKKGDTAKFS